MSLEKRITSALRSSSRLKDVEGVIAEVKDAMANAAEDQAVEEARSIDPALSTAEAREARNNAADLAHDVRRLEASLGQLRERRQAIQDDESYEQRRQRFAAAKAERDELAALIRARYPVLAMELLEMVRRIEANDAEIVEVNKARPRGEKSLLSAEHVARGLPGYTWRNMEPVTRLADATLPIMSGPGVYLPVAHAGLYAAGIEKDQAIATAISFVEDFSDAN
ncbi:hypothetical protein GCM10007897_44360 [Sphingobium jiangsuense]|uniref:hypothetical protein n=1 Tax=Sphingobium jiangsuense TaxID=870476 RepID=UPI00235CC27F|nr:hypothetical protein [Sphingobium jiangsuense]GLT02998.1 hypothetical protein GCM10007897_44360 [Sphingobium jiangsuense]